MGAIVKSNLARFQGSGALSAASLVACGVLLAGVSAQEVQGVPPDQPASAGALLYAKAVSDELKVRCFASSLSPFYEDALAKGSLIMVGEAVGEYRRVLLPIGVTGYVSKLFTTEPQNGLVETTRPSVSFRYRPTTPNAAEAPVQTLPEGTTLSYIGEAGDWWKVRFVTESAYLPINEIELIGEETADLAANHAEVADSYKAEWRDATASYEARIAEEQLREEHIAILGELQEAFQEQMLLEITERELQPVSIRISGLIKELGEDENLMTQARLLESSIQAQQVLVEAHALVTAAEPDPPPARIQVTPTPKDELGAGLPAIGWLSYRPGYSGPAAFCLQKGGRVVAYLYCNSLRYDLKIFEGVEIGVVGIRREDGAVPYLDVQKIEVLGHAK